MKFKFIVIFLFVALSYAFSQTYTGIVSHACNSSSQDEVISGATVRLLGYVNNGFNVYYTTVSGQDGSYSLSGFAGTNVFLWQIDVIAPDNSANSYSFYPSQGNQNNVDFNVLLTPQINNFNDPLNANNSYLAPMELCANNICLNVSYDYAADNIHGTSINQCFTATVYLLSNSGSTRIKSLGTSNNCVSIDGRPYGRSFM